MIVALLVLILLALLLPGAMRLILRLVGLLVIAAALAAYFG